MEVRSRVLCAAACYLSRAAPRLIRLKTNMCRVASSFTARQLSCSSRPRSACSIKEGFRVTMFILFPFLSSSSFQHPPGYSQSAALPCFSTVPLALAASLSSPLRHFSFLFLLYLSNPFPSLNSLFHPPFFFLSSQNLQPSPFPGRASFPSPLCPLSVCSLAHPSHGPSSRPLFLHC